MKNNNVTKNEEIVREIMEECKWWEKILVKIFTNTYIKVYHIGRIKAINYILKKY